MKKSERKFTPKEVVGLLHRFGNYILDTARVHDLGKTLSDGKAAGWLGGILNTKTSPLAEEDYDWIKGLREEKLVTAKPNAPDFPETLKSAELKEPVNHPQHYGGDTTYEAIKVIKAWELGFCLGNTVKYIARAGKKDPAKEIEDLKKAAWYLNEEIKELEAANLPTDIPRYESYDPNKFNDMIDHGAYPLKKSKKQKK